jgi:sugar phosphate isomerase/epimerase
MLHEIRDLGFEYAELSHGIRLSLLPGIIEAVEAGEIKITTLHNFCPLPIGLVHAAPNVFKFTATDERERENAYRHTLKTLETAQRLNARLVVLHMGEIEVRDFWGKKYSDRIEALAEEGQKDSPKYDKLCREADAKREARKEKHVQFAYDLLRRIEEQAAMRGLLLGIENREALEEIPLEGDFPMLFREFSGPTVRYWHDTGHAQIKENLGFIQHVMHLETMAPELAGFHIHDVEFPATDHRPPGKGTVDFLALKPFVKPEHIKVFEMSPTIPVGELLAGVAYLQAAWGPE